MTTEDLKARKQELAIARQELDLEIRKQTLAKTTAEAERAALIAEQSRYDLEDERRRVARRAAQRRVDHEYDFHADVHDGSVEDFANWLYLRRLVAPGKPVILNLYSPGGSVFAGFVAMDSIREAQADGVHVTAKVRGMAASMAGIIAQAADVRLIGKDSYLMLHEVSSGMFGGYKLSELADEKEFTERLTRQAMDWFARRSDGQWTVDALMAKIKKQDWWVGAAESVQLGLMDGVF